VPLVSTMYSRSAFGSGSVQVKCPMGIELYRVCVGWLESASAGPVFAWANGLFQFGQHPVEAVQVMDDGFQLGFDQCPWVQRCLECG